MAKMSGIKGLDKIVQAYNPEGLTEDDFERKVLEDTSSKVGTNEKPVQQSANLQTSKKDNKQTCKQANLQISKLANKQTCKQAKKTTNQQYQGLKVVVFAVPAAFELDYYNWCVEQDTTKTKAVLAALAQAKSKNIKKHFADTKKELQGNNANNKKIYVRIPVDVKKELKLEAKLQDISETLYVYTALKLFMDNANK